MLFWQNQTKEHVRFASRNFARNFMDGYRKPQATPRVGDGTRQLATSKALRSLRVAYFVNAFPSASETFIRGQIAAIAQRGHDVVIYTTAGSGQTKVKSHEIGFVAGLQRLHPSRHYAVAVAQIAGLCLVAGWRAPGVVVKTVAEVWRGGLGGSRRLLYAVFKLLLAGCPRYDVIHCQYGIHGVLALKLKRIGALRGPVIASFRGYDVGKRLRALPHDYDELFRRGRAFLPVSESLARRLVEAGCERARIRVHPSGIDVRRIPYREAAVRADKVRLITVARLVEKKGVAYAMEAVRRVLDAGHTVSYTVVGDGPLRDSLIERVHRLQLKDYVSFVGACPHQVTLRMLHDADVLIAPSTTSTDGDVEGIPNVLKEAMATGMPVVATRHGGIPELVEEGVSGFLVPERDAEALAERVTHLLEHRELWPRMGNAGRAKVVAEFDSERLATELERLYRSVVEEEQRACGSRIAAPSRAAAGKPDARSA